MVSILGNYQYRFPQKQPLTLRLKDMLETTVDEKYYLSDTFIAAMNKPSKGFNRAERFEQSTHKNLDSIAFTITSKAGSRPTDNFIEETKEYANYITWLDDKGRLNTQDHRAYFEDRLSGTIPAMERGVPNVLLNKKESLVIPEDTNLGYALAYDGDGVYINRPEQKRGVVQKQMVQTIKANSNDLGVVVYDDYNSSVRKDQDTIGTLTTNIGNDAPRNGYKLIENQLRIRKLTPRECYRLMGFGDQAFELAQPNQSNSSLYHQAGDSIVVNVLMAIFKELL
jgi:DNA (cytosine-5)-methyltransferase 1